MSAFWSGHVGAVADCCCQSGARALPACWCRCRALRLLLEGAVWFGSVLAARLPLPGALPGPVERFGAGMLSAACGCLCQMWCPCVGAGRLVPLQVVAAGCRCRVLLEGAARPLQAEWRVRFGAGMLVPQRSLQGPAAVCRCTAAGCCRDAA